MPTRTCGVCGNEFESYGNRKYCDRVCAKVKLEQQLVALARRRKAARKGGGA